MRKNDETCKVLILSTGRTGTLFLSSLLKEHFNGVVFHESPNSRILAALSNLALAGIFPKNWVRTIWRKYNHHCSNRVIDCNNMIYALPHLFPDEFADYKIIHIYREPTRYAHSHFSWSRKRIKSFIANYMLPFWQPSGAIHGSFSFLQWFLLNKTEKFLWVWLYKNELIKNYQFRHDYLKIEFESLISPENSSERKSLFNFVDTSYPNEESLDLQAKENNSKKTIQQSIQHSELVKQVKALYTELKS